MSYHAVPGMQIRTVSDLMISWVSILPAIIRFSYQKGL